MLYPLAGIRFADAVATSPRPPRGFSLLLSLLLVLALPACDSATTEPAPESPAALVLDTPELALVSGETARIGATLVGSSGVPLPSPSAGAARNNAQAIAWSSSDPATLDVDQSGLVLAKETGSATVTAKFGALSSVAQVTVLDDDNSPPQGTGVGVSNFQVASGRVYSAESSLADNRRAYGDRLSHYDEVPSILQGLTYIRTRNNDQAATGVANFLSFDIDRAATLVIAYHGSTPPAWMNSAGFRNSGETLVVVRDTDGARLQFQLYARHYSAGRVTLGSNRDASSNGVSMYTVILRPLEADLPPPPAPPAPPAPPPPPPPPPPPVGPPSFGEIIDGVRPRGFGQGAYTLVQPAPGRTMYWVATSGNDNNPGTSGAPFRTINRAAQAAEAGDVVTIRNGTYNESVFVRNWGTQAARIVFQAENRGGVVLGGGNNRVFQPLGWVGETGSTGPGWVTLRGLIFRDYGSQTQLAGNAVRAGRGWRIEDCLFDRSAVTGLNVVDHDVEVHRSTFQYHEVHAFLVGTRDRGATSPSDPLYQPLTGIRLVDLVLRGNHTTTTTLDGIAATRVAKISLTRGAVIDNMESFENHGQGMWIDNKNTEFVVRNSYLHSNRGFTPIGGTYRADAGRGLYLEKNWGGGVVENNVMIGNSGSAIQLVNTGDLIIRGNLLARNDRCVLLTNMTGSSPSYAPFPFRNVRIEHNLCKDWARASAIHFPGGPLATPQSLSIVADHNTYHPVRNNLLAWWPAPIGGATTMLQMRTQFGWEHNGQIGNIPW